MFELFDMWDFWLVTIWLSDLRSNTLAPSLGRGQVPSCCGSRFSKLRKSSVVSFPKETLRLGSLLVLGFSMAHSPNLQGILTSVGNFVDLAGHFTNASWGVPCVRDLFLPKYRTRITSLKDWQVYESFPSLKLLSSSWEDANIFVLTSSIQFFTSFDGFIQSVGYS